MKQYGVKIMTNSDTKSDLFRLQKDLADEIKMLREIPPKETNLMDNIELLGRCIDAITGYINWIEYIERGGGHSS